MTVFLTSSPTGPLGVPCDRPDLDPANGFVERLEKYWPKQARCLMIAAFPTEHERNDQMTWFYGEAVKNAGLSVACFDLWDDRRTPMTKDELHSYHAVFLAGGHVPTEGKWFESIRLRELLGGYNGLVIGTSAGSMNAAEVVYVWPEEPGESIDPNHKLFVPGLGLAKSMVLPHYQMMKDSWLDGKRLFADITCAHSYGHRFLAIPDGSYILVEGDEETLFGEAYLIAEGAITLFCREGEARPALW